MIGIMTLDDVKIFSFGGASEEALFPEEKQYCRRWNFCCSGRFVPRNSFVGHAKHFCISMEFIIVRMSLESFYADSLMNLLVLP